VPLRVRPGASRPATYLDVSEALVAAISAARSATKAAATGGAAGPDAVTETITRIPRPAMSSRATSTKETTG
jgi:hypothetical protein